MKKPLRAGTPGDTSPRNHHEPGTAPVYHGAAPSSRRFFMSSSEERDFILRCLEDLKDADLVHHLAVVACTLRDLQRDRKEAV